MGFAPPIIPATRSATSAAREPTSTGESPSVRGSTQISPSSGRTQYRVTIGPLPMFAALVAQSARHHQMNLCCRSVKQRAIEKGCSMTAACQVCRNFTTV